MIFLSPTRTAGMQIPGIGGDLFLDPARLFVFLTGGTDASGLFSMPLPIPNDPSLLGGVVYVQGLGVTQAATAHLGFDHFLTFTP